MATYDIELTRDDSAWIGRCHAVNANTQATTARRALSGMREAIAASVDIEVREVEFDRIDVELGNGRDPSSTLAEALAAREELVAAEARSRDLTRRVVREFSEAGVTRRDVGVLLGISGQRVDQLLGS